MSIEENKTVIAPATEEAVVAESEVKGDAVEEVSPATKVEKEEEVPKSAENTNTAENADDDRYVPEEEIVTGDWNIAAVDLKKVDEISGEEDEEVFWCHRAKLYRYATPVSGSPGEWKERGLGDAKLLQHKETKKIRFLLRQEKTLKIVANHYVVTIDPYCMLVPNAGNDKIWVWTAPDCSEGKPVHEQLAIRFGQSEQAKIFSEKFNEAACINEPLFKDATAAVEKDE